MDGLIYGLIGIIFCVILLIFWYIFYGLLRVPEQKIEHFDNPPLLYRLFKLPINAIAFYIKPVIAQKTYQKYETNIIFAGVEYQFKPEQVIAGKWVASAVLGIIFLPFLLMAGQSLFLILPIMMFGYIYPDLWLKQTKQERNNQIAKTMPFFLDMITLSIESGLNLNAAIKQTVQKGPNGVVRSEFEKLLRDMNTGISKSDAFRKMGQRIDDQSIKSLTSSIIQAEKMGMNLGPILRSQAEQRRTERFLKAEKLAMEAPVKLLFPLVVFIFPCTFIVIGFPVYVMMKEAFG